MGIKSIIGLSDQLAAKAFAADARFIASHKQNAFAFRVKGKGYSPFATRCTEPQILHIRVT
ncbi:MAG TPA: hypothetical protein VLY24_16095 [Bryobacteraceae bacterium]|nr:hypothetical protein [Bryobacteraceae bacterium]